MGMLFFAEKSVYEISKPYLKFVTDERRDDAWTDAQTDKPKAMWPFNFFKVGGIITEMINKRRTALEWSVKYFT